MPAYYANALSTAAHRDAYLAGADDGQAAAEHEVAATIAAELEALREGGATEQTSPVASEPERASQPAAAPDAVPPPTDGGLLEEGEWLGLEEEDIDEAFQDLDDQLNNMFRSMRVQEQEA